MKVRKAVFPVAGVGTRFLPATKAMPKELLPIVDKPLIQYAAEEAITAGTRSSRKLLWIAASYNFPLWRLMGPTSRSMASWFQMVQALALRDLLKNQTWTRRPQTSPQLVDTS
jgi:hypothetical protein